jgi:hypothetical protein
MDRQARTRDKVIVEIREMTGWGQTLPKQDLKCFWQKSAVNSILKTYSTKVVSNHCFFQSLCTLFWISFMLNKIILPDPKILLITIINFFLGGSRRQTGAGQ